MMSLNPTSITGHAEGEGDGDVITAGFSPFKSNSVSLRKKQNMEKKLHVYKLVN